MAEKEKVLGTPKTRQALIDKAGIQKTKRKGLHPTSEHQDRSLAFVVTRKQFAPTSPKSRQIKDPFVSLYAMGLAIEPPLPPERLLMLAEENSVHGAALSAKAVDAAGRGWLWKPLNDDVDTDRPQELNDTLERLTPDLTFSELLIQAAYEMEMIGWGVWEIVRHEDDEIGAIYPLPAHTLRATKEDGVYVQVRGALKRYFKKFGMEAFVDRQKGLVEVDPGVEDQASEVLLFRSYSPRSLWYGIPRWISAVPTLAELVAIREFNISWFQSGGQLDRSVHVTADDVAVAEQVAQKIRTQLEDAVGFGHQTLITHGSTDSKLQVQQIGNLIKEGHFKLRRGDLVKEVLMAHNMPPYRVGLAELGSLGGSAAKEMLRAYRYGSVEPIQTVIEDRLKQTIFGEQGLDVKDFKFELNDMDWEQEDLSLDIATRGVNAALLTPNEAREQIGLEHSEDERLNEFYFAGVPLGQAPAAIGARSGEHVVDLARDFAEALKTALGVDVPGLLEIGDRDNGGR